MSTPKTWAGVNPGDYISAAEFGGEDVTMTIVAIDVADFEKDDGGHEKRGVISFRETDRKMVLNKTNAILLSGIWATPTDAIGRRVTLTSERVKFGKETVDGIRVKGSPDLERPVTVTVRLPRKKAVDRVLVPTPPKARSGGAATPSAATPLRAACRECGASLDLAPDVTASDVADMFCDLCGGAMEVAS